MSELAAQPVAGGVPAEESDGQPQMWCIWGAGLIGYSLARVLAECGYRCMLVDIDAERVARINRGECPLPVLPAGFTTPRPEVAARVRAVHFDDASSLADYRRHLVSAPTERSGAPDSSALARICERIASFPLPSQPYYLVIESTICPDWIDSVVHTTFAAAGFEHGRHYAVGCSPRRDVFYDPAYTVSSVVKVIGGETADVVEEMKALYSRVGCEWVVAPNARYAALTKPIENLFRHASILLANRLTAALPGWNMRELLRLTGTKWNLDTYYPSIGIGGYCVPLASGYIEPIVDPEFGAWLQAQHAFEEGFAEHLLISLRPHLEGKRVAVLGLAYAPDIKVHVRSPTLRLLRFLAPIASEVRVHDPLYSAAEIEALSGAAVFEFPDDLDRFDTVVLMTNHTSYARLADDALNARLGAQAVILDNSSGWRHRRFREGATYREIGS